MAVACPPVDDGSRCRCETRQQVTDERLRQESRALRVMKSRHEAAEPPQSQYRREVTERDWRHSVRKMVDEGDIRYPCSDWWNEYLHCVVSLPTLLHDTTRYEMLV